MLASRATVFDPLAERDWTRGSSTDRAVHPLILSLAPALDTAFGLEPAALFPEAIDALVAALEAGPLGEGVHAARALEAA